MIKSLELSDFRSIRHCKAQLQPLTVLIGANGTGKSNIIKALDFISWSARQGLDNAISLHGGLAELQPRALSRSERRNSSLCVRLESQLGMPSDFHASLHPLVHHDICLKSSARKKVLVTEELTFHDPMRLIEYLSLNSKDPNQDEQAMLRALEAVPQSSYTFTRSRSGLVRIKVLPRLSRAGLTHVLVWFKVPDVGSSGKDILGQTRSHIKAMEDKLNGRSDSHTSAFPQMEHKPSTESFLDPEYLTKIDAPLVSSYLASLRAIKRYDLLLSELRSAQQVGGQGIMSPDGRFMPAAVKQLQYRDSDVWQTIMDALEEISPHVSSVQVRNLRGGKEFIEFLEDASGQPVESWEASDGTLRALAILIALETHQEYGTVLIEEPELGLHPWAVRTLIGHVREIMARRHIQVVMTTHSKEVLETVEPSEVLVATRSAERGTTLRSLHEIVPMADIERGDIGRLWDKGLLGGVPE